MIHCCSHALSLPPHCAQGSLNTLRVWFSAFSSMKTSVVIGHWNISKGGHSLPWFLSFSNRKTIFYWCPWLHLVYRDIKCGPLPTRCFKHPVLPLFGSSDIFFHRDTQFRTHSTFSLLPPLHVLLSYHFWIHSGASPFPCPLPLLCLHCKTSTQWPLQATGGQQNRVD